MVNKKDDLFFLKLVGYMLIAVLIVILFHAFRSVGLNERCEEKCEHYKPAGEILIDSSVPTFEKYCECKYSKSYKSFKL